MEADPPDPTRTPAAAGLDRRRFVRRGLLLTPALTAPAAVAAAGAEPWTRSPGAPFIDYGLPSPHERQAIRRVGLNHRGIDGNGAAWTPLERMEGTLTPNGLHFVRNHNGTPEIDPARHRLRVLGRVRQALEFDVESLLRYPMQSQQVFVECGGNSNAGWHEEPAQRPASLVHGLVSCSEWTGVPLRLVLQEAGVEPGAKWLVATGADAGAFHMSLPLAKAMDDSLLALFQNGERLRPDNGYPLRLLVPGWKGALSVKWLASLQLADQPAMGRNETARYTELLPSGKARQFSGVMDVKSLITAPSHGHSLSGPGLHELRGLAWSGRGRIVRVEVSVDGGERWSDAALQGPVLPRCLTRFRLPWRWDGRPALLQSRATDDSGAVQPTRSALLAERGDKGFYHYNAIVSWDIDRHGYVSHAYG